MSGLLCYRAGERALARVREGGLRPGDVATFVLPAAGPKWLIAYGVDQALLRSGLLAGRKVLLAGASAGAWRALALSSPEARACEEELMREYIGKVFTRAHTPQEISQSYRDSLARVFGDARLRAALGHTGFELALFTVRGRGPFYAGPRWAQALGLGAAALGNAVSGASARWFFETVAFCSGGAAARVPGAATTVTLTVDNAREAALGSGSVPLAMAPVRAIAGAPSGCYLDGGLSDYQLARRYRCESGLTLFFSHQARVLARWFDKQLPWRGVRGEVLADVLHVYPSEAFLEQLPGGRVPDRQDFVELEHEPQTRIARWERAVELSARLGEELVEDAESGAIARKVEGFERS